MRNAQSRGRSDIGISVSPPSREAEKFFGHSAPSKGELSVRTEGYPCYARLVAAGVVKPRHSTLTPLRGIEPWLRSL